MLFRSPLGKGAVPPRRVNGHAHLLKAVLGARLLEPDAVWTLDVARGYALATDPAEARGLRQQGTPDGG